MKQFTALVLTLCVALMGLSGFAEEAQGSDLPTVEDLKARIESFEQNHPELESLFSGLTRSPSGRAQPNPVWGNAGGGKGKDRGA